MAQFHTTTRWISETRAEVQPTQGPAIAIDNPSAFGGGGEHWTPEDLLLGAVETCLLQTFLFFVRRRKLELTGWETRTEAELKKTPQGLRFEEITVHVAVQGSSAEHADRLHEAVVLAEQYCPVANALQVPLQLRIKAESALA